MTFRTALRVGTALVTAAAVAVLAACGGNDSSSSSSATTATSGSSPNLSGKTAVMQTFGGDIDKAIKAHYTDPVDQATGLQTTIGNPTDYAKLTTQVKTQNVEWTTVQGDAFFSLANCGKLLESMKGKVDTSEIDPKYLTDDCSIPGETYFYLPMYDANKFKSAPPSSWADFFDTKKYPGKRGVFGAYVFNGMLEGALIADGVPPDQLYPLDVERARKKIGSIKGDIKFYDSLAQATQLMESGEVAMIVDIPADGVKANQNGANFKPMWNQPMESWDAYFAPKGTNTEAAAALLQRVSTAEAQGGVASDSPTNGVTTKENLAKAPTDPMVKEFSPNVDDHAKTAIVLDQAWWAKNLDEVTTKWTDFVGG